MKIAPDDCQRCPALAGCRNQVVHGDFTANVKPFTGGLMVVGSTPSQWDDKDNAPFTGKEGTLLRHICKLAGIPIDKVYRAQAVKCRPPGDRPAKKAEIDACRPFLMEEIAQVQPKVIVALGDAALQALYGAPDTATYTQELAKWTKSYEEAVMYWEDNLYDWNQLGLNKTTAKAQREQLFPDGKPKKPKPGPKPKMAKAVKMSITSVAGHTLIQPQTNIPIVVTYHPRYIMRHRWSYLDIVASHFKKAKRMLLGEQVAGTLAPEYPVISDIEQLEALRDYLLSDDVECIWFDCETTGLKWMEDEVLCWQFAGTDHEGYVVPLLHNPGDGIPEMYPAWEGHFPEFISIIREIFESPKDKGGHNILFDRRMLERDSDKDFITAVTAYGIKVNGHIRDTELTHAAVAESLPHNMTSVLANETDMPFYEADVIQWKKNMAKAPNHDIWDYGGADADGLPRMYYPLRKRAEDEGTDWVLDNVTTPLLDVCRDIEERGFLIDMEQFNKLCLFYHDQQRIWEDELWRCVIHRQPGWKYTYSATLATVLFKELELPVSGRKTKASSECEDCAAGVCFKHDQTGKDALEDIYKKKQHPIIPILLRLKKINKMITTYLDGSNGHGGFTKFFRPDGRIHPTMKVSRAETGRLASEAPNAQNMVGPLHIHPRGAKCSDEECKGFYDETFGIDSEDAFHDIVIAKPGYGIMNADWSQAEVWGLAYRLIKYTGDDTLMKVLKEGVDIHLWMARQMFPNVEPTKMDGDWKRDHKELRRRAKTCIFGIGYGLTPFGYAQREHCDISEAEDTINRYMGVVPGLPKLFAIVRAQLFKHGYIENEFGRRRHIDSLPLLEAMHEREELESLVREGINFPIQSSCSDLHSISSYQTFISDALRKRDCGIILTVHDSLTFEFWYPDEDTAQKTAHIVRDLWQKVAWNIIKPDGTPLRWEVPVEIEWGNSWGTPLWKMDAKGTVKKMTADVIAEADENKVTYVEEFIGEKSVLETIVAA